jgi:anthranilate synthase component 2
MVFVLDNYDSFTYNLVQYIGELGREVVVRRNDELTPEEIVALNPDHILLSPGPCTPQEAGVLIPLVQYLAALMKELPKKQQIPTLGVCLGHQAIGAAFGGDVIRAPHLMHGKTSTIAHDGRTIFKGIPKAMVCTRYHSLIVDEATLPAELEVSARVSLDDTGTGSGMSDAGLIMGLRHKTLPIEGVQFHPESVLTDHGKQLIANFLKQ